MISLCYYLGAENLELLPEEEIGLYLIDAMTSLQSLLPLSVIPQSLDNEFVAMEMIMTNEQKCAIFIDLLTVVNDSDVKLDISKCLQIHSGVDHEHS